MKCAAPECKKVGKKVCAHCGAHLCGWHHALQPIKKADRLKPVCLPVCESDYWKAADTR